MRSKRRSSASPAGHADPHAEHGYYFPGPTPSAGGFSSDGGLTHGRSARSACPTSAKGVAEAEIVEWKVKVGDIVREDQVVATVMTDKATVEIPTPVAGDVLAVSAARSATCSPSARSSSASTRRDCPISARPRAKARRREGGDAGPRNPAGRDEAGGCGRARAER